jgi:hypothetical protein
MSFNTGPFALKAMFTGAFSEMKPADRFQICTGLLLCYR